MRKKLLALLFVIILITSSSENVFARSYIAVDADSDIAEDEDIPMEDDEDSDIEEDEIYDSVDDVCKVVRDMLLNHEEYIRIAMTLDTYNQLEDDVILLATAIDKKDTSKDGDYLMYSISGWSFYREHTYIDENTETITLNMRMGYHTTLKQEKKVDTMIKSVLKSLKLEGKSDYTKVKAIHDYIIKRVSYDFTLEKYSAYNALIDKSSVCQGYASLAYRMFTEAGIKCRIIGADSHLWNIVKVDGKWYNIDLTWDDPNTSKGPQVKYTYFLKNSKGFKDHTGYDKIMTKEFKKKYPIAKESYKLKK